MTTTKQIQDAIAESKMGGIVHLAWTQDREEALLGEDSLVDSVQTQDGLEAWGEDWRLHLGTCPKCKRNG